MPKPGPASRDTSITTYRARRDFTKTSEPAPHEADTGSDAPIFVVQKHDATRLHYDFRLEHGDVLWSWAVPRGPSLDPKDKRLAVHVEDHPRDYATFAGTIPKGEYGAGVVEVWDRGTWSPVGDPAADLARGEMKFHLAGERLQGQFVLIRLKPRPNEHAENWLLIKEHDEHEQPGGDVAAMEQATPAKPAAPKPAASDRPAQRAIRGPLPKSQAPQLAIPVEEPPTGRDWLCEIKFDGYRMMVFKNHATVRLVTRNGLDWTPRLPAVAARIAALTPTVMLLDCELVALRPDGVSSFPDLQAALASQRDDALLLFAFDLLHLDGWDLRPCRLDARKTALRALAIWSDHIRFSDHIEGHAGPARQNACGMGLEGIIAKRADAPYRPGRGGQWVKLKCGGREEFVVLGWTPPAGSRTGLGSLHVGFYDADGGMHYAGGVGTGFSDDALRAMRKRLDAIAADGPPKGLLATTLERPDPKIRWVQPELVAEVQFGDWSGAGRLRHAVFHGLREDKPAAEVVRAIPDPQSPRAPVRAARSGSIVTARAPVAKPPAAAKPKPKRYATAIKGDRALGHPDKELWPGITKQDLADYWVAVAATALPGIAGRPLALVRCPDGIAGQHFFQKHAMPGMPPELREAGQDGAPYLAFDDAAGLRAMAQMAAIELHTWGSAVGDAGHADRLVFDLDPGDGVTIATIVRAAGDVRARLAKLGLAAFCRTSGGKGLHVVAPIVPGPDWDAVRAWCRAFAETMEADAPTRYVASVGKARRTGRILVDWLRNGLGSTAVASFSPRARPGAGVATPLAWREVNGTLDLAAFTLLTVPKRLARQRRDPWEGFAAAAVALPVAKDKP